ncbi:hypothetical protein EIP86_008751 [Pleurotus ostreatoroseus]|nr:hypothetical protein EIP86_008751 [Pleurotus ostreatoroseus]
MQYIEGADLIDLWPSLSWWRRLRIVWTLRGYISQLRKVKVASVPGPIDATGEPLRCSGNWFTEAGDGPFPTYHHLASWFNSKRRISIALSKESHRLRNLKYTPTDPAPFDDSAPLVLTHGDISLWNVRIGKDGTVWLLDWGYSGVYPQWFESAGFMAYDDFNKTSPRSWLGFAPLIVGRYKSQNYFIRRIGLALIHWGVPDPDPEPLDP